MLAVAQDVRSGRRRSDPGRDPAGGRRRQPGRRRRHAAEEVPQTIFTLEVTPEQAERIAFAFENGSIWMTLVPADFIEVETDGVTIETLFAGDIVDDIFGN